VYPGIYSRSGVKAIRMEVRMIRIMVKVPNTTNTFSLESRKVNRSSRVSSFMITSRYLFLSLLINDFFFLSFLFWAIPCFIHFPKGLQISEKNANGEKKKKNV
jgi:hypothetical protein